MLRRLRGEDVVDVVVDDDEEDAAVVDVVDVATWAASGCDAAAGGRP